MNYTKEIWNCTCDAGYRGEVYHCPMHKAAPDMYEALKDIRQLIKIYSPKSKMGGEIRFLIQKVLAKANGE